MNALFVSFSDTDFKGITTIGIVVYEDLMIWLIKATVSRQIQTQILWRVLVSRRWSLKSRSIVIEHYLRLIWEMSWVKEIDSRTTSLRIVELVI
jgi:hypothetical protein